VAWAARRRASRLLASVLACVAVTGCGNDHTRPATRPCERFCVTVEPVRGNSDTVFRFTGRNWLPRREVIATYGVYCPPGRVCILIAKRTRLRTDGDGGFVFRFRNGPRFPREVPPPRGAGGGPVAFRQRIGAPESQRLITRAPRYFVDGRRVGRAP
jgi:hypothetical protein